ncbi:MAG: carbon storage regulator [Planctomycetota bacterium]|nr:carbon storage regulator [Planctomycetota bacterium]
MGRLVLERKRNEEILIGTNIRIQIVDVRGSNTRVLIEAPDNLVILRGELAQEMAIAGVQSARTAARTK